MRVSFKTLMAAGLALAGSMVVQPLPAEAQPYWDPHDRAGWGYRPYGYAPAPITGPAATMATLTATDIFFALTGGPTAAPSLPV